MKLSRRPCLRLVVNSRISSRCTQRTLFTNEELYILAIFFINFFESVGQNGRDRGGGRSGFHIKKKKAPDGSKGRTAQLKVRGLILR